MFYREVLMGMTPIQRYRLRQHLARLQQKKEYLAQLESAKRKRKRFIKKIKKFLKRLF